MAKHNNDWNAKQEKKATRTYGSPSKGDAKNWAAKMARRNARAFAKAHEGRKD